MRNTFLFLASLFSLCACSSEVDTENHNKYYIEINTIAQIDNYDLGLSRAVVDNPENTNICNLFYENGDGFGLFADGGYQIPFFVSGLTTPSTSVSVIAEGWDAKPSMKYATYYPFNKDIFNSHAIPFSYSGAEQSGNASVAHMSDCMLIVSNASECVDNKFIFNLEHAGTNVRFQLTMDAADERISYPIVYTRMAILGNSSADFITYGEYNLFSEPQQFENIKTSRVRSINLKNFTINSSSELLYIFMSFAAPLTLNGSYTIILWDENGNTYTGLTPTYGGTILSKNTSNRIRATMSLDNAIKTVIEQYAEEDAASGHINTGN